MKCHCLIEKILGALITLEAISNVAYARHLAWLDERRIRKYRQEALDDMQRRLRRFNVELTESQKCAILGISSVPVATTKRTCRRIVIDPKK